MQPDRLSIATQNSNFYQKNYYNLIRLAIGLTLIDILLILSIFIMHFNRPTPIYFITTVDGKLIEITPKAL